MELVYTKEKLDEALYFLLQMRNNYVDRRNFIFNMNAFLNSARNITFTLQAELGNLPDFSKWYRKEQEKMKEDALFSFFNDLRVISVHKKGVPKHKLSLTIAYVIPKDGINFKKTSIVRVLQKFTSEDKKEMGELGLLVPSENGSEKRLAPTHTLVTDWQFENPPKDYEGADILALSIYYYYKLKELVEAAEEFIKKKMAFKNSG